MRVTRILLSVLFYIPTCNSFTSTLRHSAHHSNSLTLHLSSNRGGGGNGTTTTANTLSLSLAEQYRLRLEADPAFLTKSITEVILAAGTQLTAEVARRGWERMIPEGDFVLAGLLTAIAGKYYSMWRVAPTGRNATSGKMDDKLKQGKDDASLSSSLSSSSSSSSLLPPLTVSTNAFQTDRPYTLTHRIAAFLIPIPSLFRAGAIASFFGYGLTSLFILLRSALNPSYVSPTVQVNVLSACLYTGSFMATVSNVRYQLLQGIIEPRIIERLLRGVPRVKAVAIFGVRLGNGLLGSYIAIWGMKVFGLQKLK